MAKNSSNLASSLNCTTISVTTVAHNHPKRTGFPMKRLPRFLLFGALVFIVVRSGTKRNETNKSLPKNDTKKDTTKETAAYLQKFREEIWSHSRLCLAMEREAELRSRRNG